ncbi:flippase-like domain-containing protein [Gordonia amarae]|uniref:Integral membrane protein n=2 Tax=Gordonia amarae TaxID=36821 RepID=G7GUX6_9ACTN|nr:YbhN family protein [Gordonia amarae]MCS3877100.1 uncharacterized protein (TIRG00374 family) [Gordonia amarae]QHN15900.1 flippase-like domain-containing protein [Gordonia amarae]QHN20468.1 flippase-like domain-containing protein [Gordonia amarae]QHN29321.1 flippase-like domain-containing protein [Gordonia amarae]QHN38099.1 flippase-like domain-containing protein [Gordonia amarae]
MSSDGTTPINPSPQHRWRWVKRVLLVLIAVTLIVEAVLIWPKLKDAWASIGQLNWAWVLACIVAAMLSMDSFAQVQRTLFRSAGVKVSQFKSLSVVLAANSVSQTMPGGQVLAPAFTYRQTRKWGATPVVASWQVVMSGLLAGVGLAVLGFGGAMIAGAKTSPFSVLFSVLGFIAVATLLQYFATHPEYLQSTGIKVLEWINQFRNKPLDHGVEKLLETLEQLRAVQLNRRDTTVAFGWSFFNWVTDVACLMFACWAVDSYPSYSGLMVAYAASKAVGTAIPLLPGGIGVVDAMLVPALTSAGMPVEKAITAVLVYRLISYVFVAVVGWVIIYFMFRSAIRSEGDIGDELEADEPAQPPPDTPAPDTTAPDTTRGDDPKPGSAPPHDASADRPTGPTAGEETTRDDDRR